MSGSRVLWRQMRRRYLFSIEERSFFFGKGKDEKLLFEVLNCTFTFKIKIAKLFILVYNLIVRDDRI